MSLGFSASARAIPKRCRWPPAVSKVIHNTRGAPQLSIVIAAIDARFPSNRIKMLAAMLERECNRIEQVLEFHATRPVC